MIHKLSTWIWLSGRREKEILLRGLHHLDLVYEVVKKLLDMISSLSKMELVKAREYFNVINKKEEEADVVKREIIEELSKGIIHPMDREDLLRLILSIDDIAAYAKASARRIKIVIDLGYSMPDEFITLLYSMVEHSVKAVDTLRDAIKLLTSDPRKALQLTYIVEEIEEKVDDIRLNALEYMYRMCSRDFRVVCLLYKEIIDDIEIITDKCEDTADTIRSIAIHLI